METGLALLRLALERGWTLGLLFLAFCGSALTAAHYGLLELPDVVKQWSGAGVLFGAATTLVSIASHFVSHLKRHHARAAERRAEADVEAAEALHVLANLSALDDTSLAALESALSTVQKRFEVHMVSDGRRLVDLGLFSVKDNLGTSWICEVHPAIAAKRAEILKAISNRKTALGGRLRRMISKFDEYG
jgi:hypothetical protein